MKLPHLLACALVSSAAFALDLTPQIDTRDLEGVSVPVVRFFDGSRKVIYQPPAGWRITGEAKEVKFIPGERADANARLQLLTRQPEMGDLKSLEELEEWVVTLLPADAENIVLQREVESAFTLDTRPSHEYVFTFQRNNLGFTKSITVVDLDDEQRLLLLVTARDDDFKALREEMIASMFSWHWE